VLIACGTPDRFYFFHFCGALQARRFANAPATLARLAIAVIPAARIRASKSCQQLRPNRKASTTVQQPFATTMEPADANTMLAQPLLAEDNSAPVITVKAPEKHGWLTRYGPAPARGSSRCNDATLQFEWECEQRF
jgi:hypothetical protein